DGFGGGILSGSFRSDLAEDFRPPLNVGSNLGSNLDDFSGALSGSGAHIRGDLRDRTAGPDIRPRPGGDLDDGPAPDIRPNAGGDLDDRPTATIRPAGGGDLRLDFRTKCLARRGLRGLGFRNLGFRNLGFRSLGF